MGVGGHEIGSDNLLSYKKPDRGAVTYVGTPRDKDEDRMDALRNSTKRNNSIEGDPSKVARDSSLERLDKDAMSLDNQDLQRPNKQVNITN